MKTLIVAVMALALLSPAHAKPATCIGRAHIEVADGEGLDPKGTKTLVVGDCAFEDPKLEKRVLRTCPMGSRCRVEGDMTGDNAIETIVSVTRVR
jgi:hypothetical protein